MYFKIFGRCSPAALALVAGCVPSYKSSYNGLGASRVSSISVKLPAVEQLEASDGSKPVNGMHLSISPVDRQ